MSWLRKLALTDKQRINSNLNRLDDLSKQIHELGFFAFSSQSGSYQVLEGLINDKLVLGRPKVRHILQSALTGENRQKLVLDSPTRFQSYMNKAEEAISLEINKELRNLRELEDS